MRRALSAGVDPLVRSQDLGCYVEDLQGARVGKPNCFPDVQINA